MKNESAHTINKHLNKETAHTNKQETRTAVSNGGVKRVGKWLKYTDRNIMCKKYAREIGLFRTGFGQNIKVCTGFHLTSLVAGRRKGKILKFLTV